MTATGFRIPLATLLAMFSTACATTSTSSTAAKSTPVQLLSEAPSDCAVVGPVEGAYRAPDVNAMSVSFRDPEAPKQSAREDLQENAAKRGATHVVIAAIQPRGTYGTSAVATGTAYRCPK